MFEIDQLASERQAADFLNHVEQIDDAYFVDRSKYLPNISLDSSRNKYLSMTDISMPADILETIDQWLCFKGIEPEEILVNRYYPGMSIGPHKDKNINPYISVVFLNKGPEVLSIKPEDEWILIPDVPGQMVTFDREMIHKVDPVETIRHSIIIIRESL